MVSGDKRGEISKKVLACTKEATDFQREYYRRGHEAAQRGEPIACLQPEFPFEVMHAMDVMAFSFINWSALLAAKQLSHYYIEVCENKGYFHDLCRYCGKNVLGYLFDTNTEIRPPYGGLPKLTFLGTAGMDDPLPKIGEIQADILKIPKIQAERTYPKAIAKDWWVDPEIDPRRFNHALGEIKRFICFVEEHTGKGLSESRLRQAVRNSVEVLKYWHEVDDLRRAAPTPISCADYFANIATWWFYRGTEWAVEHYRKVRDEVKERVDNGVGVIEDEKVRLMWDGFPPWFSLGFFNAFEKEYNAVFAYEFTYHLPLYYENADFEKPVEWLAYVYADMFPFAIGIPQLRAQMVTRMALEHRIDGVILTRAEACKQFTSYMIVKRTLEEVGIPSIIIDADMVDIRDFDDVRVKAEVGNFIETLTPRRK